MQQIYQKSFGNILRQQRKKHPKNVSTICKSTKISRSRWYRWEKGLETPLKIETIQQVFDVLNIKKNSSEWYSLFTLSYLSHNKIPPYLVEINIYLDIIFEILHKVQPTKEEFIDAMAYIKRKRHVCAASA